MKNLRICREHAIIDEKNVSLLKGATKMCTDANYGLLFVALKNGRIVSIDREMKQIEEIGQELGWDETTPLVGFDYLYDEQQLCLVLSDGRLLLFSTNTKELNCVMELKRNIFGCSWSPDLHLLIIATDTNLLMVSREFQVIAEAPIRPITAGKEQLLAIGWGSAETQFQGSIGKQNVHKQDQQRMPIPIREAFDDQRIIISWRGDAQFFVVSSVDEVLVLKQADSPSKNGPSNKILCRQLRVWNRELDFMSQCEFLAGIEAALCIRPTGNLIAVPAVLSNERHLWFYERNGQIRNKFKLFSSLPSSNSDDGQLQMRSVVRHLAWNSMGSILMLCYEDTLSKSIQLQFWTVSNYSWTEKLRFSVGELADWFWDDQCSNSFHYLTKAGVYRRIMFRSEYNCEDMIAVSINGDRVRVSDLKYAPIPPPMCHFELFLDFVGTPSAFVQSPVFGLAFVSSDFTRISTFSLQNRRFIRSKRVEIGKSIRLLLNLTWRNANTLLAFRKSEQTVGGGYELVEIRLDTFAISSLREFDHLPFAISLINAPNDQQQLPNWISNEKNYVKVENVKLDDDKCLLTLCTTGDAAEFAHERLSSKTIEDEKGILVFHLFNKMLFVNGKELHSGVLSYCCTKEFLVLVAVSFGGALKADLHQLFCFPIALVHKFATNNDETFECVGAGQKIERLSQLIANEPKGTRVWLQMERGNLEVIHPRPILIERLKCLLDAREWTKAFVEMRRHRIDLNLLYDHNPKIFNDSIEHIFTQISDVDALCVFLTSLKAEDTTQTMFAPFYPERQSASQKKRNQPMTMKQMISMAMSKVNGICERIRNHLMSLKDGEEEGDSERFSRLYPVVLCCYFMETPSRISAALVDMCAQITKMKADKPGDEHFDLIRQWTKHLSNLVKEKDLFTQALKTYDVEIALMVAQSSNLDPKEYLPVLNDLKQKTPSTYQKYHIDIYLEDWNSALNNIATLAQLQQKNDGIDVVNGEEKGAEDGATTQKAPNYLEECLKLIQQQKLYSSALKLFCGRPHYKEICAITAKELEESGRLREAAIFYEKTDDLASAMKCHLNLQNFSEYCRLAKLHKQSDEKTESELRKMGTQLIFREHHLTAAAVFVRLGKENNFEKIIECYEKANAWNKLSVFVSENQCDLPGIVNRAQVLMSTRCAQIIEQIDSWRDTVNKHTNRLDVLRAEKRAKIEAMALPKQQKDDEHLDTFSESSVTSSSFSNISSVTQGMGIKAWIKARKTERKKLVIKEGSHWEDGALLVALKDIFQRIDTQQDELVELLPALLSMDLVERACRLQNEMLTFLEFISVAHKILWPSDLEAFHLPGPLNELFQNSEPGEPMPRKIQLTNELIPPKLRSTGVEWKLEIIG